MNRNCVVLCGVSALALMSAAGTAVAQQAPQPPAAESAAARGRDAQATTTTSATVQELIVTAQKREESINDVGMSIQAETGDRLNKLGIRDTSDLQKIVPGFQSTPTYYGTYVFTIRGVGFQDTSLAGNPTVSVYADEAPLPFSILTNGATLDLERVEVLKGPQGTLFGNNATGGRINYIARKPTDHWVGRRRRQLRPLQRLRRHGLRLGPITDTLSFRAGRAHQRKQRTGRRRTSSASGDKSGGKDFLNGRVALQWQPTDNIKASLTVNAWQDKGYTQNGQLFGIAGPQPAGPLGAGDPRLSARAAQQPRGRLQHLRQQLAVRSDREPAAGHDVHQPESHLPRAAAEPGTRLGRAGRRASPRAASRRRRTTPTSARSCVWTSA
jgi:outer membrane receptor protein involved in Fe transport